MYDVLLSGKFIGGERDTILPTDGNPGSGTCTYQTFMSYTLYMPYMSEIVNTPLNLIASLGGGSV